MGWVNIDGGDIAFVRVLGPIQVVKPWTRARSAQREPAPAAGPAGRGRPSGRASPVRRAWGFAGRVAHDCVALRKGLGDMAIVASQGRYRLAVPVDAALFTASLSQLGAGDNRVGTLERALALWTGPAFEEFSAEAWAGPAAARLAELHASAIEDHAVALIIARRWAGAIADLKAHVSMNPLREGWAADPGARRRRAPGRRLGRVQGYTPISPSGSAPNHRPRSVTSSGGSPPGGTGQRQRQDETGWGGRARGAPRIAAARETIVLARERLAAVAGRAGAGPPSWDEPASWGCWPQRRPR